MQNHVSVFKHPIVALQNHVFVSKHPVATLQNPVFIPKGTLATCETLFHFQNTLLHPATPLFKTVWGYCSIAIIVFNFDWPPARWRFGRFALLFPYTLYLLVKL